MKVLRECDRKLMLSLLSPLLLSDEIKVDGLLRADTGNWIELDPIAGITPTQTLLRCLQRGHHLEVSVMHICCVLLQKRDSVISNFYSDVNCSSSSFQPRLKSLYLVNIDIRRLFYQLPDSIPLHRIYIAHHCSTCELSFALCNDIIYCS